MSVVYGGCPDESPRTARETDLEFVKLLLLWLAVGLAAFWGGYFASWLGTL